MLVRPMLLHCMALVSVRLFCKNLGNLPEFFGQMVYRPPSPPWQKIARTPMFSTELTIWVAMITDSKVFRSFGDCKSSSFYFWIMISYPKFGSYTPMFRIPDMIDEFRVICFIFSSWLWPTFFGPLVTVVLDGVPLHIFFKIDFYQWICDNFINSCIQ